MVDLFFIGGNNLNSKKFEEDPIATGKSRYTAFDYFLDLLSSADDITRFKENILGIVKEMGFTDYLFMRSDRHWLREIDYGLLYSVPEELMRIYHDEKMYIQDILVLSSQNSLQPLFMSTIYTYFNDAPYETDLIEKNRRIQQLNKRFSFFDHYAIPMTAFNGHGNVQLVVTHKNISPDIFRPRVNNCSSQIHYLCKAIDFVSTQQFYDSFINYEDNPSKISPRQLAVISMLANSDLTITEVAYRMNISPITAHQHISSARRKLGVATNIAAIKKLVKLECIPYK
jgi:DNA-binding CsgD family transcriptional regulator